jgi:tRNA threonylcarbamoyladenosine biosynthesis protein TsaB
MRHGHGEALLPMIDAAMTTAHIKPEVLDVIAVAVGPGGFTGIRVGLAAAHGIALAVGARLVGATSFAAVAELADQENGSPLLIALDSRRADLYVQLFDTNGEPLAEPAAVLSKDLPAYLMVIAADAPLRIAGDATADAAAALGPRVNVSLLSRTEPNALGVLRASRRRPSTPARAFYLRPPDVTLSKRDHRSPPPLS